MISSIIAGRHLPDPCTRLRLREEANELGVSFSFLPRKISFSTTLQLHELFIFRINESPPFQNDVFLSFLKREGFFLLGYALEQKYLVSRLEDIKFLRPEGLLINLSLLLLRSIVYTFKFLLKTLNGNYKSIM